MKYLFLFLIALLLAGAIALNNMPQGVSAMRNLEMTSNTKLISLESSESNAVETNGIRFETVVPQRMLTIPKNQPGAETPVKFGIRIANHRLRPMRFAWSDTVSINLFDADGKALMLSGGRDSPRPFKDSDISLVAPGKSAVFFLEGKFSWQDNQLRLGGPDGFGGFWYFRDLKPGTYRVQFFYRTNYADNEPLPEDYWSGFVTTPLVEFRVVK